MNFAHYFHKVLVIGNGKYTDVFIGNFFGGVSGGEGYEEFFVGKKIFHEGGAGF